MLAFAVVESESYERWLWFLRLFRQKVMSAEKKNEDFTISSDWMKGIPRTISEALPAAYHSYYIRHLTANFYATFKNVVLRKLFSNDAYSLRESDFKEAMEYIKAKNAEAEKWISEISKENWANANFKGARWNVLTTNASECFNNVLKSARELTIASLIDHCRWKVQDFFQVPRKEGAKWQTRLTRKVENWFEKSCEYSSKFRPYACSFTEYEVKSLTNSDQVDLEKRRCT
ncbi:uncharacterized protein LOC143869824 [Tasmannia lanceolata]|uniref:uncharacterized protein LOC143869824 n=1 Tax=Tasmannia lanceolata TaxID=3420 RepID=UPI004062F702